MNGSLTKFIRHLDLTLTLTLASPSSFAISISSHVDVVYLRHLPSIYMVIINNIYEYYEVVYLRRLPLFVSHSQIATPPFLIGMWAIGVSGT